MESSPALAAWLAAGQRVRLLGHELFAVLAAYLQFRAALERVA